MLRSFTTQFTRCHQVEGLNTSTRKIPLRICLSSVRLMVVKRSELSLKSRAFYHIQLLMGSHHEIFPTFFATDFRECLSEARQGFYSHDFSICSDTMKNLKKNMKEFFFFFYSVIPSFTMNESINKQPTDMRQFRNGISLTWKVNKLLHGN